MPVPTVPAENDQAPQQVRTRLIDAAIQVFGERGYAGASVREICQRAQANVAAISYHFGGKEELYREVLGIPLRSLVASIERFGDPGLDEAAALAAFFTGMLAPIGDGSRGLRILRLHHREAIEPSGLDLETGPRAVEPHMRATLAMVRRLLAADRDDDEVRILALSLVGLAHAQVMASDPDHPAGPLAGPPPAWPALVASLVRHARAMLAAERRRRQAGARP